MNSNTIQEVKLDTGRPRQCVLNTIYTNCFSNELNIYAYLYVNYTLIRILLCYYVH